MWGGLCVHLQEFWSLAQHLAEAFALHSLNNLIVERLGGAAEVKYMSYCRVRWSLGG